MRLCLGMMVSAGEASWLRLHLPVILKDADLDGIVFVSDPETDQDVRREIVRLNLARGDVYHYEFLWHWDFSEKANHLIECAETLHFDAMVRLDPDELVYPTAFATIRQHLAGTLHGLRFARFNFGPDRLHYNAENFPDPQFRAFWLRRGVRYHNPVHEMPVTVETWYTWPSVRGVAIYHYSGITPPTPHRWLQHTNYARLSQKLPPLLEVPEGLTVPVDFAKENTVPYEGEQPLDPAICGACAPFEMAKENV